MTHHYFGENNTGIHTDNALFPGIHTPDDLFSALLRVWCRETCAPRLRHLWSAENPTAGQCSVSALLAQDIFGGSVYEIPLPDGTFHSYNCVNGRNFDLACEQFGERAAGLCYENNPMQDREARLASMEKRRRYLLLKRLLMEYIAAAQAE